MVIVCKSKISGDGMFDAVCCNIIFKGLFPALFGEQAVDQTGCKRITVAYPVYDINLIPGGAVSVPTVIFIQNHRTQADFASRVNLPYGDSPCNSINLHVMLFCTFTVSLINTLH